MSLYRIYPLLLACGLAVVMVLIPGSERLVSACTGGRPPEPTSQGILRRDLVFVGEVIAERSIEYGGYKTYESTIRIVSTLKGTADVDVIISPLPSAEPDCTGGPRLPRGARALVLLESSYRPGTPISGFDAYNLAQLPSAQDTIRRVAAITNATEQQLARALLFVGGEPTPPSSQDVESQSRETGDGWESPLAIGLAIGAGLAVAAVAFFGVRRLRAGR
ncbi:MAG: hypothetical protein A2148_05595 [Chloroflexi bacterium RBG_16_68_14]|nr:MAG: hypothetical protein A2148_05595 [Chloroflexi bacterium RBG_16_68_14]